MLDELPHLQICKIEVYKCNNEFIDALVKKSNLETKQDLFKVLRIDDWRLAKQSEPHEYVNLKNIEDAPLSDIMQILSKHNINHIGFGTAIHSDTITTKSEKGYLVLYDNIHALYIHFKDLSIESGIESYQIQGDYVIFYDKRV